MYVRIYSIVFIVREYTFGFNGNFFKKELAKEGCYIGGSFTYTFIHAYFLLILFAKFS